MDELRSKTCCLTGHRTLPPAQVAQIAARLEVALQQLIGQGYRYFGVGGARGFDTLAAQCILRLRASYPAIRLILVLPCRDQTRGWPLRDKLTYHSIKRGGACTRSGRRSPPVWRLPEKRRRNDDGKNALF